MKRGGYGGPDQTGRIRRGGLSTFSSEIPSAVPAPQYPTRTIRPAFPDRGYRLSVLRIVAASSPTAAAAPAIASGVRSTTGGGTNCTPRSSAIAGWWA